MRHDGGLVIALGAALALAVCIYNFLAPVGFLAPQASVAGTPGAALLIFSTAALLVAGLVLAGRAANPALIWFLMLGALAAILGTALGGWLLESPVVVGLMLLSLVGWAMRLFMRRDALA